MKPELTRRSVMGALACAVGMDALRRPAGAAAQGRVFDVDAVVVGAGAAGLAAARRLRALGRTCVVLEARARVGGRVFTERSLGAPWDAGARYIHWSERNPWTSLAREAGVETVDSATLAGGRRFVDQTGDPPVRRGGFSAIQALLDPDVAPVPDVSLIERIGGPEAEGAVAAFSIARMALGDEPERISALDYARLWAGDDLVAPQGYGTLVERAAKGLDIRLSTPVAAIDWSGAGVRVTTGDGVVSARAAIVTLPVGVLKSGAVRFTPQLPQRTRDGLEGLGMGALSKIALKFNGERFGVPVGMDISKRLGPRASFNFKCWAWDRDLVIATFGGDHARDVVARGEAGAIGLALDEFAKIVGARARESFVAGRLAGWSVDPFALGCYSHARPGHAIARALLAEPVGDRLWFAGEATAGSAPDENFGPAMTAGGAWLAGVRAAEAVAALKG